MKINSIKLLENIIKKEKPKASFALGEGTLRYRYNPNNAEDVKLIGKHFNARYPKATLLETPKKDTFGWNNDSILITGYVPASSSLKLAANLIKRRLNSNPRYTWGPQADLEWNYVGGLMRHLTPEYLLDELGNNGLELFLPLSESLDHAHGWYDNGRTLVRMDPWRKKPIRFTGVHEGVSHPTDQLVMPGNPNLGIINKLTGKTLKEDYEGVTNPTDLFGEEVKNFSKDSKKPVEGRAMHLELMMKMLEDGAKEKGLNPNDVINNSDLAESIIKEQVDKFQTPELLADYMDWFSSGYLKDYQTLLRSKTAPSVAKESYLNRWKKLLKYAPAAIPAVLAGAALNNNPQVAKNGLKLIPRKYVKY